MKLSNQLYIDGAWTEGRGAPFASRNPATDELVWEGKSADAADVDRAVLGRAPCVCFVVGVAVRRTRRHRAALRRAAQRQQGRTRPHDRPRNRQAALGSAHRSGDDGREGRYLRAVVSRAYRRKARADGRWRRGLAASSAWRRRGVWPLQLSGAFAERAYRAGADRGQRGGVQAVRTRAGRGRRDRRTVDAGRACPPAC